MFNLCFDFSFHLALPTIRGTINSHFGYLEMLFVILCISHKNQNCSQTKPWQLACSQLISFGLH